MKSCLVDDNKEQLIQTILTGAMISIVAALTRALLVKKESLIEKIRTFSAGVLLGTLTAYLLRNVPISSFYKELLTTCMAAFIATVWPLAEKKFIKWFGKKADDVLPTDMD